MKRIASQDWYRIRRVSDGITFIDEPYIQEFYRCKYVDHIDGSIGRAVADFESEAIPWFAQFQVVADLPPRRGT